MATTAGEVSTVVTDIQSGAAAVLEILQGVDPALAVPVEAAENVTNLLGSLVTKAIAAFQAAAGVPVTAASVEALMPNPTPPTTPTS